MGEYVFTGVGRTGWHIDGSFQLETGPFHSLIYPHHITQRRRTSKMGVLSFLCVFRVFEQLQLFLKPTRNVQ